MTALTSLFLTLSHSLLLTQGARVNAKDNKWLTPLHRAVASCSEVTHYTNTHANVTSGESATTLTLSQVMVNKSFFKGDFANTFCLEYLLAALLTWFRERSVVIKLRESFPESGLKGANGNNPCAMAYKTSKCLPILLSPGRHAQTNIVPCVVSTFQHFDFRMKALYE